MDLQTAQKHAQKYFELQEQRTALEAALDDLPPTSPLWKVWENVVKQQENEVEQLIGHDRVLVIPYNGKYWVAETGDEDNWFAILSEAEVLA